MTFERTQDYSLIRQILTHPKVYKHISDDGSPKIADYRPPQHDAFLYLTVHDGPELLGLYMFHPITSACLEVHTCLYPAAGRHRARDSARQVVRWIWEHTGCRRIITNVPAYNRPAQDLARFAGFTAFGRNKAAFPKFGKLHDLILMGISKPEGTPCRSAR